MVSAARENRIRGTAFSAVGAVAFAVSIVITRSLALDGLSAATVYTIRFGAAAALTFVLLCVLRRPLVPARGEWIAAIVLGLTLYFGESAFFFLGLERGTAATVTLIFYAYPALVALIESVAGRSLPSGRLVAGLVLSGLGCATIVLSTGSVSITMLGVVFALLSAATVAVYIVLSQRLLERTDALTTVAWTSVGAAIAHLIRGSLVGDLQDPTGHLVALLANAAATVVAFGSLFTALKYVSASHSSVVFTIEVVATIVLAWLFLGESVSPAVMVGAVAVVAAAILLATTPAPAELESELDEGSLPP